MTRSFHLSCLLLSWLYISSQSLPLVEVEFENLMLTNKNAFFSRSSIPTTKQSDYLSVTNIPGMSKLRSSKDANTQSLESLMDNVLQLITKRISEAEEATNQPKLLKIIDDTASTTNTNHQLRQESCNFYVSTFVPQATQENSLLLVFGNEAPLAMRSSHCSKNDNILNIMSEAGYQIYGVYSDQSKSSSVLHSHAMPMPSNDDKDTNSFCNIDSQTSMNMLGFVSIANGGNSCVILLFSDWVLDNVTKFSIAIVGVFLYGIFVQIISNLRHSIKLHRNEIYDFFRTGLGVPKDFHYAFHAVLVIGLLSIETVNIYLAMLIAMTYNIELFVSLVGGMMLGFFVILNVRQSMNKDTNGEVRQRLLPAVGNNDHATTGSGATNY